MAQAPIFSSGFCWIAVHLCCSSWLACGFRRATRRSEVEAAGEIRDHRLPLCFVEGGFLLSGSL